MSNPFSGMRYPLLLVALVVAASVACTRPFSVVVYNVENLFDADGVAAYDDYQPSVYTPAHLATKLAGITQVLVRVDQGAGPDVILFSEIEADQTPASTVADVPAWLARHEGKPIAALLAESPLPPDLAGVSAEVWLQKGLSDAGLRGYTVVNGDTHPSAPPAVKCVIFSRFPVKHARLHAIPGARPIMEVELSVEGYPLYVFNNHWKSGASEAAAEAGRRAVALVLRARLDEILAADANADILIGGDLNSHYNQKTRYRELGKTGINDVLGSQGNELALRGKERDLYNLWFELPSDARGSDVYKGEWGTLMNLIVSRGLYDQRGVQYEDNSFSVMKIPGLNADVLGLPQRWKPAPPQGSGFSDHFPLYARFRTVTDNRPDRWMPLTKPNTDEASGTLKVDYAPVELFKTAIVPAALPIGSDLRDGSHTGKIFHITAPGFLNEKGYVTVSVHGQDYEVYSHKKTIRDELRAQVRKGKALDFYGELGTFKGTWQFVVQGKEWVK